MEKPIFKVQKIVEDAIIPSFQYEFDAGMDISSIEEKIIPAHGFNNVGTGLRFEIPKGYEIQIRPRSGLSFKYGVSVLNAPGTIDSGFRGEVRVVLFNVSDKDFKVEKGMRIAQMVVGKLAEFDLVQVDSIDSETLRSDKGFGSSGI